MQGCLSSRRIELVGLFDTDDATRRCRVEHIAHGYARPTHVAVLVNTIGGSVELHLERLTRLHFHRRSRADGLQDIVIQSNGGYRDAVKELRRIEDVRFVVPVPHAEHIGTAFGQAHDHG